MNATKINKVLNLYSIDLSGTKSSSNQKNETYNALTIAGSRVYIPSRELKQLGTDIERKIVAFTHKVSNIFIEDVNHHIMFSIPTGSIFASLCQFINLEPVVINKICSFNPLITASDIITQAIVANIEKEQTPNISIPVPDSKEYENITTETYGEIDQSVNINAVKLAAQMLSYLIHRKVIISMNQLVEGISIAQSARSQTPYLLFIGNRYSEMYYGRQIDTVIHINGTSKKYTIENASGYHNENSNGRIEYSQINNGIADAPLVLFNRRNMFVTRRPQNTQLSQYLLDLVPIVAYYYHKIPRRTAISLESWKTDIKQIKKTLLSITGRDITNELDYYNTRLGIITQEIDRIGISLRRAIEDKNNTTSEIQRRSDKSLFMKVVEDEVNSTIDRLVKIKTVNRVTISKDGTIIVETHPIISYDSITKKRHQLGKINIQITMGNEKSIRIFPNTGNATPASNQCGYPYPHVFRDGTICAGTGEIAIRTSLVNNDIATAIILILTILESPNMADSAGQSVKFFPTIE